MLDVDQPAGRSASAGGRRWPLVVVVVLGLAMAAVSAGGIVAWQRGSEWEDVAAARAERLRAYEAQLAEVSAQRDEAEARLDALAAEKALAEDERAAAEARQQQAADLAALATRVANDLEACVVATRDLLDVVSRLADYDQADVVQFATAVEQVCSQALGGNRALQQAAAGLGA